MLTQFTFTTTESKRLIAKAVYRMPEFQKALKEGIIVMHPSSTTSFIFQEITGKFPEDGWVFGTVTEAGFCRSRAAVDGIKVNPNMRKQWIFKNGKLQDGMGMEDAFALMGKDDIFVKGCNAIDSFGNCAVVSSNPDTGGTSGKILKGQKERGFKIIVPTGLEKMIQGNIAQLDEKYKAMKPEAGIGLKCGLFRIYGDIVTEKTALKVLFGLDAESIQAGGIQGAEGAVTLFFDADEKQVEEVTSLYKEIQGSVLPKLEYVAY